MQNLQNNLGHQFKNLSWLRIALRHRSCGAENNERLEFLGDSILNFIVAELIFEQFPDLPEGKMSRLRAGLVREATLVKAAERIGIKEHLQVVHTDRTCGVNPSMLADALEALFAAVYFDAGHEAAKRVIRHHMITLLQNGEAVLRKDPKTALQELLQGRGYPLPIYSLGAENSANPLGRYMAICEVPALKVRTTGYGNTRKQAESYAADVAIKAVQ